MISEKYKENNLKLVKMRLKKANNSVLLILFLLVNSFGLIAQNDPLSDEGFEKIFNG